MDVGLRHKRIQFSGLNVERLKVIDFWQKFKVRQLRLRVMCPKHLFGHIEKKLFQSWWVSHKFDDTLICFINIEFEYLAIYFQAIPLTKMEKPWLPANTKLYRAHNP
jgi:hypothetical protein